MLTLYTVDEFLLESNKLRNKLQASSFPFNEVNVTYQPECVENLQMIFGQYVQFPGIEFNGAWFNNSSDILDKIEINWVDYILQDENEDDKPSSWEKSSEIHFEPYQSDNKSDLLGTASTHSSCSTYDTAAALQIPLPNGNTVSIAALTRELASVTKHHRIAGKKDDIDSFYFDGKVGMQIWANQYFGGVIDDRVKVFARDLIDRGIVTNLTPEHHEVEDCRLVLQPLTDIRALNIFIKWPKRLGENDNPTSVMLRLSHTMDDFCSSLGSRNDSMERLYEIEEAVCQLQVVPFPKDPVESLAFTLNLHNLMVRHAMLLSQSRGIVWPERLSELQIFLSEIGYYVDRQWYSLYDVQLLLFGRIRTGFPKLAAQRKGLWQRLMCVEGLENPDIHYKKALAVGDPRLLFAMTLGTLSSPRVLTIDPENLEGSLIKAAERFCRERVQIIVPEDNAFGCVVLPPLLAYHRMDFGGEKERILDRIMPYFSMEQLRQIQVLHDTNRLRITFDRHYSWQCGLPLRRKQKKQVVEQIDATEEPSSSHHREEDQFDPEPSSDYMRGRWLPPHRATRPEISRGDSKPPASKQPQRRKSRRRLQDDDQASLVNPTVVSELTYGSEFDLMSSRSFRRRVRI